MKELKTLIVNGNEYTVTDPNAARIDDAAVGEKSWSSKNIADRLCPAFSESGPVATCTPVDGYPLGVISHIRPVQTGSGDPSPENVRPITGHAQIKLTRCGKNLSQYKSSDETNSTGHMNYRGLRGISGVFLTVSADITRKDTTLTEDGAMRFYIYYTDGERTTGSASYGAEKDGQPHKKVITLTADATKTIDYLRLIPVTNNVTGDRADHIQIEIGALATAYEPYRGDTFTLDLGQTVYGGSLNWQTGELTVTHGHIASYAGEEVPDGWISSTGQLSDGAQVVYPMEMPVTVQLTPQQILALTGVNTLYSDTGDTAVTGRADPAAVMEKLTNAILALGGNI